MPFLCGHITHSAIMFLPTRSKITSFMSEWNISCVLCAWSDCSYFPVSWTVFLVITQLLPSKNCSSYKHSVYIFIGLRVVAVRRISTLPFQIFPLIGFSKLLQSESWWDFAKNDSDPTDYDKIPWSFIVAMFFKNPILDASQEVRHFAVILIPFKCPVPSLSLFFFSSLLSNLLLDVFLLLLFLHSIFGSCQRIARTSPLDKNDQCGLV